MYTRSRPLQNPSVREFGGSQVRGRGLGKARQVTAPGKGPDGADGDQGVMVTG
jgi:hypothetical protein